MKMQLYKGGQEIFKQGDPGDAMYILMEGRVEMRKTFTEGGKPVVVGETNEE